MSDAMQPGAAPLSYEAHVDPRFLGPEVDSPKCSVMVMGSIGSRKTTWACQWPAPVFLSIAAEGADVALKTYPQIAQYLIAKSKDKAIPPVFNTAIPQHWNILFSGRSSESANLGKYPPQNCLMDVLEWIEAYWKQWGIATVVLDSTTFLERLWMSDFAQYRLSKIAGKTVSIPGLTSAKDERDPVIRWAKRMDEQGGIALEQSDFGLLAQYFQNIQERLNSLPVNRVLTAHPVDYRNAKGDLESTWVALAGKSKTFIPGGADLIIQAEMKSEPVKSGPAIGRAIVKPVYWTIPDEYSKNTVRHRFAFAFPEGKLVDPEFGDEPTFRALYMKMHESIAMPRGLGGGSPQGS